MAALSVLKRDLSVINDATPAVDPVSVLNHVVILERVPTTGLVALRVLKAEYILVSVPTHVVAALNVFW